MDLHLLVDILAVIWIGISLWLGGLNALILFVLLTGIGQPGKGQLLIRNELGIVWKGHW